MGRFGDNYTKPKWAGRAGYFGKIWKCDTCGEEVKIERNKWPDGWVERGEAKYGYGLGLLCPKCANTKQPSRRVLERLRDMEKHYGKHGEKSPPHNRKEIVGFMNALRWVLGEVSG